MSTPAEPDDGGLTDAEREALRDWWDDEGEGATSGSMLGNLDAVVERILAARMATAKAEAWDEGRQAFQTTNPYRATAVCAALGHDEAGT